nr:HK97 family phage prohead protease [Bacillus subtilis]
MIDKRALDQTDMSDVRALIDHDPSKILGRTSAGTLKLEVDDIGLRFDVTLPNTQYASDLYENLRVGNISNCSFGFMLGKDGDSFTRDYRNRPAVAELEKHFKAYRCVSRYLSGL